MISAVASFLVGGLFDLLILLVGLLPSIEYPDVASTLTSSGFNSVVGYLNWFIPVGQMLGITTAWAAAVLAYNAYRIFSGWLKAFKS